VKWLGSRLRASAASAATVLSPASAGSAQWPVAIKKALLERAGSPRGLVTFDEAVAAVCDATGWPIGHAWVHGPTGWRSSGTWHVTPAALQGGGAEAHAAFRETTAMTDLGSGRGIVAAVLHLQSCRFLPGLEGLGSPLRQAQAAALRLRGVVGVPVHSGTGSSRKVSAVFEFVTAAEIEPDGDLAEALLEVAGHARRRVVKKRPAVAAVKPKSLDVEIPDHLAG
jgi:hypothetical protein